MAVGTRERLRNRFFEVGLKVLQQHQQTRQGAQAVALGRRLLALDPVHEDVVRALVEQQPAATPEIAPALCRNTSGLSTGSR